MEMRMIYKSKQKNFKIHLLVNQYSQMEVLKGLNKQ